MAIGAIEDLVGKLKRALAGIDDPAEAAACVAPLLAPLAKDTSWIEPRLLAGDESQGFGVTILHEEPDPGLLVETVCWLPGRGVAPHDHQTWGVVMGLEGAERNIDWRRLDDGSRPGFADLVRHQDRTVGNGDVLRFLPDDIHSVVNEGRTPSLSLHVYGRSLARVQRSEFDPIAKLQRPCPQRRRGR